MSFESAHMSYTYVITPPSIWLPNHACVHVMVLGGDPDWFNHVQEKVGATDLSWALYHVSEPRLDDASLMDWILINQKHVQAVWCNVTSHSLLTCALMLPNVCVLNTDPPWDKLCHWGSLNHMTLDSAMEAITRTST